MRSGPQGSTRGAHLPALLIHNNLIQKAKFANFGYTVEQVQALIANTNAPSCDASLLFLSSSTTDLS